MFLTNDPQYDPTLTSVRDLVVQPEQTDTDVYTLSGQLLRRGGKRQQTVEGLPAGVYVIGGKKVIVK